MLMPTEEIDITGLLKGLSPIESITSTLQTTTQQASDTTTAAQTEEYSTPTEENKQPTENTKPTVLPGTITLDNLIAVDTALKSDVCQSIEDIMKSTGLDENTVTRCIEFLVDHGLVAKSAMMYCGLRAVEKLIGQLRALR